MTDVESAAQDRPDPDRKSAQARPAGRRRAAASTAREASDRRQPGIQPLAAKLRGLINRRAKGRGLAMATLACDWPQIVGSRIADLSRPARLAGRGEALPLVIHADPSVALIMLHRQPQLMERINMWLGGSVISQLRIDQGPVQPLAPWRAAAPPRPQKPLPPDADARLEQQLEAITDPALRESLRALGEALLRR